MQMQTGKGKQPGIISIVRELGIFGLYTGLRATILRDVPFNAIYFTSYAYLKHYLQPDGDLSTVEYLFAGTLAGSLAAAVDTPADTIKTRLQNGKYNYKGVADAFVTICKEEGPSALLKGVLPRVLIISPLFGITFTAFEYLKHIFS